MHDAFHFAFGDFTTAAGGKGANQAVEAARAGGQVTFVARVGSDLVGEQAIAGFKRDGICVDHVLRDKTAPSGVALIFVARDSENCIAVAGGANAKLSPSDVKKAAKAGVCFILNPAPARPLPDPLLACVSILTPNETEAELLTGIKITNEAAAARFANAAAALSVTQLGAQTSAPTRRKIESFLKRQKQPIV